MNLTTKHVVKTAILFSICLGFSHIDLVAFGSNGYSVSMVDTIKIGNTSPTGSGGNIWTDQYPIMVITPDDHKLKSIRIYIVSTSKVDSLRLIVKSNPSYGCSTIGGVASPFGNDSYTIGISENILPVAGAWNQFEFEPPIQVTDSIFIWPDLLQQIQPRIQFASTGNEDSLYFASCASGGNILTNDYQSEFTFVPASNCGQHIAVVDDSQGLVQADTISSTAIITMGRNIVYQAAQIHLIAPFEVELQAVLETQATPCNN